MASERPYFRFGTVGGESAPIPEVDPDSEKLRVTGPSGTYHARAGRAPKVPGPVASREGVAWTLVDPAPGMAIDGRSGLLTAVPSTPGIYQVRARASLTNERGQVETADTVPFALAVYGLPVGLSYPPSSILAVGSAARVYPSAASNLSPMATYELVGGPGWLAPGKDGVLSGTPPGAAPAATMTVTARDFDDETVTSQPFSVMVDGTFASVGAQDLADAVVGVPASMSFAPLVGLTKPVRYEVVEGRLPKGIEVDAANDRIAGRAQEAGVFPGVVVMARDARDVRVPTRPFSVTVAQPALAYADRSVLVGESFEHMPSTAAHLAGAAYSIAPDLPPGQEIDGATGRISGRMDATAPRSYVVTATTQWLSIPSAPFALSGATRSFTVERSAPLAVAHVGFPVSISFSAGVSPVTWAPGGTPLPDGLALDPSTGKVAGAVNQAQSVTGTTAVATGPGGQSVESGPVSYTILPKPSVSNREAYFPKVGQAFDEGVKGNDLIGQGRFTLEGSLPDGLVLTSGGRIQGTPTAAGQASGLVVHVTDAHDGATGSGTPFTIRVTDPGTELSVAGVQDSYRVRAGRNLTTQAPQAVNATQTPAWSVDPAGTPLPDGLSVDTATGVVSGVATAVGTTEGHVIRVADGSKPGYARSVPFAIVVAPELSVEGVQESYTVKIASPVNLEPVAQGALGSVTWELAGGTLPQALSFDPGSGQVGGAPLVVGTLPDGIATAPAPQRSVVQRSVSGGGTASQPGSASSGYYLRARDSYDGSLATSRRFAINVQSGLVVMGPNRYRATVGLPFSSAGSMFATGAKGPVGWSLTAEERPGWLNLDGQTGVLSGVPTASGSFKGLRLVARSGTDTGSSPPFEIEVVGGLRASAPATVRAHRGRSFAWMTASATGAMGSVSWSVASGNLPPGMTLNPSTGTVGGVPTTLGTFTDVRLRASDAGGQQGVTDPVTFVVGDGIEWILTDNDNFHGRMDAYVAANKPPTIRGAIGKVTYSRNPASPGACLFSGCTEASATIDRDTGIIRFLMEPATRNGNNVRGGAFLATDETGATAPSPYYMGFRSLYDLNFYDCYDWMRSQGYCWSDTVQGTSYSNEAPIEHAIGPLRWEIVRDAAGSEWLSVDQETGRVWGTSTRPGIVYYTLKATDSDGVSKTSARAIDVKPSFTPPTPGRGSFTVRHNGYREWRPLLPTPEGDFANVEASWKREEYRDGALATYVDSGGKGLNAYWSGYIPMGEYLNNNIKAIDRSGNTLVDYSYDLYVIPPLTIYYTKQEMCLRLGESRSTIGPRVSGQVGNITFGNSEGKPANLPAWISLDTATGGLTAAPTDASHKGWQYIPLYAKDDADGTVTQSYVYYTIGVYDRVGYALPAQETLNGLRTGEYTSLRLGLTGDYYNGILTLVGGRLPPGMRLYNGTIEGYPSEAGPFTARLRWDPVTCGSEPIEFDVSMIVNAVDRPYGTIPSTLYFRQGVYGQSPALSVSYPSGEPLRWDGYLSGAADGLKIDPGAGFAYGTPSRSGVSTGLRMFAQWYRNGAFQGTIHTNYFDVVIGTKPTVTLPETSYAHKGSPFALAPAAADFMGPVAWTKSGDLPPGMEFDERSGAIVGASSRVGTYPGIVVTGTETEAPTDANGVIQARQSASSKSVSIVVTEGPVIGGIKDVMGKVGEPAALGPVATGLVGAPRWTLLGTLPEGTLTLDRDTGILSGTPRVAADASVQLILTDTATGASATSDPFKVTIAGSASSLTWRWGEQVCTYGCTASGCSGRQRQVCEGAGCTAKVRGCEAPFLGSVDGTSHPIGQEAKSCEGETAAPNEAFCPTSTVFKQWLYWPTGYQTKGTAGFIVNTYKLGCFLTTGLTDDSVCGTPPTTITTCRMNGLGYGWCDPAVPYAGGSMMYVGYSDETGWYD